MGSMSDRLQRSEFVPLAPEERGKQVKVYHCREGRNNDRLYIKRNEDGTIVAYCHHCGKRGFAYETNLPHKRMEKKGEATTERQRNRNYYPSGMPFAEWLGRCRAGEIGSEREGTDGRSVSNGLLWKAGLTEGDIKAYRITPSNGRLWIPLMDKAGRVVQAVGRAAKVGIEPKWDREIYAPEGKIDTFGFHICEVLVLTEDALSAIRVANMYDSLPCLGTSLNEKYLTGLEKYDTILVWLDNDNPQVMANQLKMKNRLDLVHDNVHIVKADEPKHMTDNQIIETVEDYI